jgi:hypothetical protein
MSLNDEAWALVERLAARDTDHETLSTLADELLKRRTDSEVLVERRAEEGLS